MKFDLSIYLKLIDAFKAKAIDDVRYADLLLKIPKKDAWQVLKQSDIAIIRLEPTELDHYETNYRVALPDFLKYLLTDLGQSLLIWLWFFDPKEKKLWAPDMYLTESFFLKSIERGISHEQLERFENLYDIETNTFSDTDLQSVYQQMNADDDQLISKLLYTGHGSCAGGEYVLLNSFGNGKVVYTGDWATQTHVVNGNECYHYSYGWQNEYIHEYALSVLKRKLESTLTLKEVQKKYA